MQRWEKIVASGSAPPSYPEWTEEDEVALLKLEPNQGNRSWPKERRTVVGSLQYSRCCQKGERAAFIKEKKGEVAGGLEKGKKVESDSEDEKERGISNYIN